MKANTFIWGKKITLCQNRLIGEKKVLWQVWRIKEMIAGKKRFSYKRKFISFCIFFNGQVAHAGRLQRQLRSRGNTFVKLANWCHCQHKIWSIAPIRMVVISAWVAPGMKRSNGSEIMAVLNRRKRIRTSAMVATVNTIKNIRWPVCATMSTFQAAMNLNCRKQLQQSDPYQLQWMLRIHRFGTIHPAFILNQNVVKRI